MDGTCVWGVVKCSPHAYMCMRRCKGLSVVMLYFGPLFRVGQWYCKNKHQLSNHRITLPPSVVLNRCHFRIGIVKLVKFWSLIYTKLFRFVTWNYISRFTIKSTSMPLYFFFINICYGILTPVTDTYRFGIRIIKKSKLWLLISF